MKIKLNLLTLSRTISGAISIGACYLAYVFVQIILSAPISFIHIPLFLGLVVCLSPIWVTLQLIKNNSEKSIKDFCLMSAAVGFFFLNYIGDNFAKYLPESNLSLRESKVLVFLLALILPYLWYKIMYRALTKNYSKTERKV